MPTFNIGQEECFLCWELLDHNRDNNTICSEKDLQNYTKYIRPQLLENSVDRIPGKSFSTVTGSNSLCSNCYDSSKKLSAVNDVLEAVQKELFEIVETLNNYIAEYRNDNDKQSVAKEALDLGQIDCAQDVKCNSDYEENFSPESNLQGLELESNETADSTPLRGTNISQQTLSTPLPDGGETAAVVNPFDLDCRIILERIDYLPYGKENALQPKNIQFISGNNASSQSFDNGNDNEDEYSPHSPEWDLCIADSASNGLLSLEDGNDLDIKDIIVEGHCNDDADEYSHSHDKNIAKISAGQELPSQGTTQASGKNPAYTTQFDKEIRIVLSRVDVNRKTKGKTRTLRPRRTNEIYKPNSEPEECTATSNREKNQNDSDSDFVVDDVTDKKCSYENRVKRRRKRNRIKTLRNVALRKKEDFNYPCRKCPEKFNFEYKLKLHLVRMHPEKTDVSYSYGFKCKDCGRRFRTDIGCKQHQGKMHGSEDDKEFEIGEDRQGGCPCSLCDKRYCDIVALERHKKLSHGITPMHACKFCDKKCRRISNLRRHIATRHSKEFNFPCDKCSEKFKLSAQLGQHKRVHEAERLIMENDKGTHLQCSVCNQSFKKEDSEYFVDHMLFHKNENRFLCKLCEEGFATKVYLEKHNYEKHYDGFPCKICGNKLSSFGGLQKHLQNVHADNDNKIMCEQCGAIFKSEHCLRVHYLTHGKRNLSCKICGKKYVTKNYLRLHIRQVHNKEANVTCEYCGLSFGNNYRYQIHVRSHTGEKPFGCNLCQEKFDQKVKLNVHKSKVHNIGKIICKTCGKEFNRKHNLALHMRVHTGEKPYGCNLCDKRFDRKHNFTTHMRFHTGEKPYKCPNSKCGKTFSRKDNLNIHVRKCPNT